MQPTEHWLWTISVQQWRYAREIGIPYFDITVKSGIREFAPDWDFLMAYKRGEINEVEYCRYYHAKVLGNLQYDLPLWQDFLQHPQIAIACYCKPGDFCHRYLFTNLLAQYLQCEGRRVIYQGEILPPATRPR